jgi:archaemetzincin
MNKRIGAKKVLWLICFMSFFSCKEKLRLQDPWTIMVIQPVNGFSSVHTSFVKHELEAFFGKKIEVLPLQILPETFANYQKGKRYDAVKIIKWLTPFAGDSVLSVIALTDDDIFTTQRDASGQIKKPESTYRIWGIFGLGYCPGRSCVVSEKRLYSDDARKFAHRLRTVAIHEVGHNLGLPHCPNKGCIMSDANEKMATVDMSGDDYCEDCNRKIGRKPTTKTAHK